MRSSIPKRCQKRTILNPTIPPKSKTNLNGVRADNFEPRPRTLSHLLLRGLSIGS